MKAIEAATCVDAWLQGCSFLLEQPDWRAYTVVLEIADPLALPAPDRVVHDIIDGFLRRKGGMPISTVVNTIFPAQLYARYGAAGVYERYPALHPKIQCHDDARGWGTYAMRMIERIDRNGEKIRPLAHLVDKIGREARRSGGMRAAYELGIVDPLLDMPLYDPHSDRGYIMGGPCLSHVSVKLTKEHAVHLTGFYRSHYYVERALGNFFGLAHLQHFIAQEAGLALGPLVVHSSMAQLDTSKKWGVKDVRKLIGDCVNGGRLAA
jgi:hypothetical protein